MNEDCRAIAGPPAKAGRQLFSTRIGLGVVEVFTFFWARIAADRRGSARIAMVAVGFSLAGFDGEARAGGAYSAFVRLRRETGGEPRSGDVHGIPPP